MPVELGDYTWPNKCNNQGRPRIFFGGGGVAPPGNFDTMDGKMVHYDAIWNAILKLQRQVENKMERVFLHYLEQCVTSEKKNQQACILTLFETIWNFRDFFKTQGL